MSSKSRKLLAFVLLLAAAVLLALALRLWPRPTPAPGVTATPEPVATATPEPPVSVPATAQPVPETTPDPALEETPPPAQDLLPVGKLVVTKSRSAYESGDLTLYIPVLNVERTIQNGTDEAALSKGVGLFEYAQLPGEGNRNVSLAGHRNGVDKHGRVTDRAPFYYVDTLKEGDYLYLTDSEHVYRYLYSSTTVVEPDDWSPIYVTQGSTMTITSCTPIGVSDHRIVVRATLDEIFETDDDFDYRPVREEESP